MLIHSCTTTRLRNTHNLMLGHHTTSVTAVATVSMRPSDGQQTVRASGGRSYTPAHRLRVDRSQVRGPLQYPAARNAVLVDRGEPSSSTTSVSGDP